MSAVTNNTTSLTVAQQSAQALAMVERSKKLLAEAKSLETVLDLKNQAGAIEQYLKRNKAALEAQQAAAEVRILGEHRLGELLRAQPKNRGERGQFTGGCTMQPPDDGEPTYEELRIEKTAAHRWQKLAEVDKAELEGWIEDKKEKRQELTTKEAYGLAKKEKKKSKKNEREARKEVDMAGIAEFEVRVCSCADLFASGIKPDVVITDPPYPKEHLSVFSELADSCRIAAVPLVAVMSGQSYLPEVMIRLCKALNYRWTMAYLTPGGQSSQQWKAKVNTFWKPVLLFGDTPDLWIGDVVSSKTNDNDKNHHHWGQSESGMAELVAKLSSPGELICDPFLGGGTTGYIAVRMKRRFIGCDIDSTCVEKSKARIGGDYV